MADQEERENFYRHCMLIVDHVSKGCRRLLKKYLSDNSITLEQFIERNQHVIYHLFNNIYLCCLCQPGLLRPANAPVNRVLRTEQLEILLDIKAQKLPGHKPKSRSQHCCSPANSRLSIHRLDLTLTKCLLINCTNIVPTGSAERVALDKLTEIRNTSYGHASEGRLSNTDYQKHKRHIEANLLVLARVYGEEHKLKEKLKDIENRMFNESIWRQLHTTLLAEAKLVHFEEEVDIEKSYTEGCDARIVYELAEEECSQNINWMRNGNILQNNEKYCMSVENRQCFLEVLDTTLSDNGSYFICLDNKTIKAKLNIEAYFSKRITDTHVIEGENAKFICEVIDDNVPSYWFKDGVQLLLSESVDFSVIGKQHTLVLNNVALSDIGVYSVVIQTRTRKAKLCVEAFFKEDLEDLTVMEGDDCMLKCEVRIPDLTAIWSKDGTHLTGSETYQISVQGTIHILKIIKVGSDQKGTYSIEIDNLKRSSLLTVVEIPDEIKHLCEEDKEMYVNALKEGKEVRHYIRVMIIGKDGVGKTCLLKRLLGESIEGVESTDGINIVRRCLIRLNDGKWLIDKAEEEDKHQALRFKQAVKQQQNTISTSQIEEPDMDQKPKQEEIENSTDVQLKKSTKHTKTQQRVRHDTTNLQDLAVRKASKVSFHVDHRKHSKRVVKNTGDVDDTGLSEDTDKTGANQYRSTIEMRTDEVIMDKSESFKILDNIVGTENDQVTQIISKVEKYEFPKGEFAECGLWDFAGQRDYYATHQIFLTSFAVYLLVADITEEFRTKLDQNLDFDEIGDYIDFWLDSIHCFHSRRVGSRQKKTLEPPVLLILTNIDRYDNTKELDKRKEKFMAAYTEMVRNQKKGKHVREVIFISNTSSTDNAVDKIRKKILELATTMSESKLELPLKWIRLENAITFTRSQYSNIVSLEYIVKLAEQTGITDKNEIILFLKYQHSIGNIIFFEDIKDYIILNTKWLVNAFKCLISHKIDHQAKFSVEWKDLTITGRLEHSLMCKLFENKAFGDDFHKYKEHLMIVLEKFGILKSFAVGNIHHSMCYYMPCMIKPVEVSKESLNEFYTRFGRHQCSNVSPWICFEFTFLPVAFFYQIFFKFLQKYEICTTNIDRDCQLAIYHGKGVFFLTPQKRQKLLFVSLATAFLCKFGSGQTPINIYSKT